ncbi:hypothetical protein D3C81_1351950 [compost metagenome]
MYPLFRPFFNSLLPSFASFKPEFKVFAPLLSCDNPLLNSPVLSAAVFNPCSICPLPSFNELVPAIN